MDNLEERVKKLEERIEKLEKQLEDSGRNERLIDENDIERGTVGRWPWERGW